MHCSYVVRMISCVKIEVWEEVEWVTIVSLSEPGDSCKVCSWIHPQGVRWWRLGSLTFVLTHPEVEVGCWGRARSAQAEEEEVSVVNLRKGDWRLLLQEVRRVRRTQHLRSCWTSSTRSACKTPLKESEWKSSGGLVLLDIVKDSTEVCEGEKFEQELQVQAWRASREKRHLVI